MSVTGENATYLFCLGDVQQYWAMLAAASVAVFGPLA